MNSNYAYVRYAGSNPVLSNGADSLMESLCDFSQGNLINQGPLYINVIASLAAKYIILPSTTITLCTTAYNIRNLN
jgi:hypothetical protein